MRSSPLAGDSARDCCARRSRHDVESSRILCQALGFASVIVPAARAAVVHRSSHKLLPCASGCSTSGADVAAVRLAGGHQAMLYHISAPYPREPR